MSTDIYLMIDTIGLPRMAHDSSGAEIYPPYVNNPAYNSSRIVRMAWALGPDANVTVRTIRPQGFTVYESPYHDVIPSSTDVAIANVLADLVSILQAGNRIICNNSDFVKNILLNEAFRQQHYPAIYALSGMQWCSVISAFPSPEGRPQSLATLYRTVCGVTEPYDSRKITERMSVLRRVATHLA